MCFCNPEVSLKIWPFSSAQKFRSLNGSIDFFQITFFIEYANHCVGSFDQCGHCMRSTENLTCDFIVEPLIKFNVLHIWKNIMDIKCSISNFSKIGFYEIFCSAQWNKVMKPWNFNYSSTQKIRVRKLTLNVTGIVEILELRNSLLLNTTKIWKYKNVEDTIL